MHSMYEGTWCPVIKQLAGNSCKVSENVLCPAVIMGPNIDVRN